MQQWRMCGHAQREGVGGYLVALLLATLARLHFDHRDHAAEDEQVTVQTQRDRVEDVGEHPEECDDGQRAAGGPGHHAQRLGPAEPHPEVWEMQVVKDLSA